MVRPISLRLRNAEIIAKARATLIKAGRGPELERRHAARVMEEARATVERRREQDRLQYRIKLAADRAILAVRKVFWEQDKVDASEAERAVWHAQQALILDELQKIANARRRP
jgi:hypothetical protein